MANKWLVHVKHTMKTMKKKGTYKKGLGLKQVIAEAKKTYQKAKRGGADEPLEKVDDEAPVPEGGRRHKRTHRRRRHH